MKVENAKRCVQVPEIDLNQENTNTEEGCLF